MEYDNIVTLNDENGMEVKFEFLDLVEYDQSEYVVLLPIEQNEDGSGEVVILMMESIDTETESYVRVDDEKVLRSVFEIFKEKYKNDFEFED